MILINKKAQINLISIAVAIMIFIAGVLFINFIDPVINTSQNSSNLNCDDPSSISDGNKLSCLVSELVNPYYILIILSFTGGIIVDRFL